MHKIVHFAQILAFLIGFWLILRCFQRFWRKKARNSADFWRNYLPLITYRMPRIYQLSGDCPVEADGRRFGSPVDAALHLLWLLQRLSYYEPHREGMPADGPRFREAIRESRKLLNTLGYEPGEASRNQQSAIRNPQF